jgi:hypothetical protein
MPEQLNERVAAPQTFRRRGHQLHELPGANISFGRGLASVAASPLNMTDGAFGTRKLHVRPSGAAPPKGLGPYVGPAASATGRRLVQGWSSAESLHRLAGWP